MKADATFVQDWRTSQDLVNLVALWLVGRGQRAFLFPTELRPDSAQRSAYRDQGDIMVLYQDRPHRVEVKGRGIQFTGAHDYPYRTVFIDEAYKLTERSGVDPLLGYVIVSLDRAHVAVIHHNTEPHWLSETRHDPAQRRVCTFLACPKAHARWFRIATHTAQEAA